MKDMMKKIGVWAFMVGIVLALLAGVLASNLSVYMGLISTVMVLLGLVVGALNISDKEVTGFIIAAVGLATGSIAIANLGNLLGGALGGMLETAFRVFGVFVAGVVFVPALKAVYKISKD
ncbi:MAG: hypothetical protein ABIJ34_07620 [archaeon]